MAYLAKEILNTSPIFEISINNFEKPKLDWISLEQRTYAIQEKGFDVVHSPFALFEEKMRIFDYYRQRNMYFVVGHDTYEKIYNHYTRLNTLDIFVQDCFEKRIFFLKIGQSPKDYVMRHKMGSITIETPKTLNFKNNTRSTDIRRLQEKSQ